MIIFSLTSEIREKILATEIDQNGLLQGISDSLPGEWMVEHSKKSHILVLYFICDLSEYYAGVNTMHTYTPISVKDNFFYKDAESLAKALLGKILAVRTRDLWLKVRIIETEAYYQHEKASHAYLGYTQKRHALFMPPGTIYMYYARGGDSLNFSALGKGDAVLIKSGYPIIHPAEEMKSLQIMLQNNPKRDGNTRSTEKLCAGQTLLCKSLGLKVPDWDGQQLNPDKFDIWVDSYVPEDLIKTTRLGISPDRDAQLPLRFIDAKFAGNCTKNPLRVRNWQNGIHYTILQP